MSKRELAAYETSYNILQKLLILHAEFEYSSAQSSAHTKCVQCLNILRCGKQIQLFTARLPH